MDLVLILFFLFSGGGHEEAVSLGAPLSFLVGIAQNVINQCFQYWVFFLLCWVSVCSASIFGFSM